MPDQRKSPRLLYLDTGLVNYRAGVQDALLSIAELSAVYRGRIAEHLVGQELIAANLRSHTMPLFWVRQQRGSSSEVDFLYQHRSRLIPIEVKSGKAGTLRSLHQFMERVDHDLAVRVWDGGIDLHPAVTPTGRRFRLLNLPYYLVHRLDAYLDWAEQASIQPGAFVRS